MKWAEVCIETVDELRDTVVNLFFENNFKGIMEKRDIYTGNLYITSYTEEYNKEQIENLRDSITALKFFGINGYCEIKINYVLDDNWATAWKKYYKPFKINDLVIKPTWEPYKKSENEKLIEIDPDIAFGTGQHPTTELCIKAIQDYLKPNYSFIDAGCGSGILGLVANQYGFDHGYAFDIEESAVKVSKENFKNANINNIECFKDSNPKSINEQVDIIFANIIATVIKQMAEDLVNKLKPGGILISSGIIENRYEEIKNIFENLGLKLIEKRTNKEWVCLILTKENN